MSRSFKKAFTTLTRRMSENAHSIVRRIVKEKLHTIDIEEPNDRDLLIIDADCRELDLEDWGTKFGLEFCDEEYWAEDKVIMSRK